MKTEDINIRDPFVLPYNGVYYLYGTRGATTWKQPDNLEELGFDVYTSNDLENWSTGKEVYNWKDGYTAQFQPDRNFWAPEVHEFSGKFYMFATLKQGAENRVEGEPWRSRGTAILVSDRPNGRFVPCSKTPLTPDGWECLDGTLFVDENKIPWLVFCHEWTQVGDGEICAQQLTNDLTETVGEVQILFKGSAPKWAKEFHHVSSAGVDRRGYITDGTFVWKRDDGKLLLFWATLIDGNYAEAISISDSGNILGPWRQLEKPFFDKDGGHGMLFKTFEGKPKFTLHQPNTTLEEHPVFFDIDVDGVGK